MHADHASCASAESRQIPSPGRSALAAFLAPSCRLGPSAPAPKTVPRSQERRLGRIAFLEPLMEPEHRPAATIVAAVVSGAEWPESVFAKCVWSLGAKRCLQARELFLAEIDKP